jgi:hypothetical protein
MYTFAEEATEDKSPLAPCSVHLTITIPIPLTY